MSFFKHFLRSWTGNSYGGHHGRRDGHYEAYRRNGHDPMPMARQPCAQCGTMNAVPARFCAQCGTSLKGLSCAACGKEVPPDARFCPHCGQTTGSGVP